MRFPKQRSKGLGSIFRGFLRLVKPLISSGVRIAKPLLVKTVKPLLKRELKRGLTSGVEMLSDEANKFIHNKIKTENDKSRSVKKRKGNVSKKNGRKRIFI